MIFRQSKTNHIFPICTFTILTACSPTSGENFTRIEGTSCSTMVFPDGEEITEVAVHYEVPESSESILAEGASCSIVLGENTIVSEPDNSRFTWCEVNGLPSDTKVTIGLDHAQKTASVAQSLNWTSLAAQTIECVLNDGRYKCDGKVMLSAKPFYIIGLNEGKSTEWREGGDFPTDKKTENFFGCFERGDPANPSQKQRFESLTLSDGRSDDGWKCRFDSGPLSYEISSMDLKTAVLSGGPEVKRELTCSTYESETSYH